MGAPLRRFSSLQLREKEKSIGYTYINLADFANPTVPSSLPARPHSLPPPAFSTLPLSSSFLCIALVPYSRKQLPASRVAAAPCPGSSGEDSASAFVGHAAHRVPERNTLSMTCTQ